MNDRCKALLYKLDLQLKFISLETDNPLISAELSIQVAQKIIDNLKSFILKYKFKNTSEVIKFLRFMP